MNTVSVGHGVFAVTSRILLICPATRSSPILRIRNAAKDKDILIDATYGRKANSVIFLDTGHVVLSTVRPRTLVRRMGQGEG